MDYNFIFIKERSEGNRPYVQISFELIRSSLACIVIRNVGDVPLSIKSLSFSKDFINQINERERATFLNKEISKSIENNTKELKRIHTIINMQI